MCEVCEQAPASVTCKADAATLCSTCDVDVHSANPLAHHNLSSPPRHHHRDLTNLLINLSSKFSVEQCQLPPQIFSIFANSSIPRISRKMSRKRNQSDDEEDDTFFYRYSSTAACCAPSALPPTGVACVTACCAPSAAPPTERRTNQEQNLEGSGEISCGIVIDIKEKGRIGDELQFHHSSSNSQRLQAYNSGDDSYAWPQP